MKVSLVLGSADCLAEDLWAAEQLVLQSGLDVDLELIALNDVGAWLPRRIHAWATLHPEKLGETDPEDPDGLSWIERRAENGYPDGFRTYARRRLDLIQEAVQPWGGGSVALYGVRVAEHRDSDLAILCGCPLDPRPYHNASISEHTLEDHLDKYRRAWTRKIEQRPDSPAGRYLIRRTRSPSGWTRSILGPPTSRWLTVFSR